MPGLVIKRCTPDEWREITQGHPYLAAMQDYAFAEGADVWSGVQDGVLLGAAGFLYHAPKQAYVWGAFLTERWPKVPRTLLKVLKAKLGEVVAEHALTRVEAKADCAHIAACRFLEALGFRCEGLTACSNQYGEDQFLYAFVTPRGWSQRAQHMTARYGRMAGEVERARIAHVTQSLTEDPGWRFR